MKKIAIAAVSLFALAGVAACGESATDKAAESQADAIEAQGEARADSLEAQAAQAPTAPASSEHMKTTTLAMSSGTSRRLRHWLA